MGTLLFSSTFGYFASANADVIIREGESADSISAPMKVYSKSTASGGRYIATNTDGAGKAVFKISIATGGVYHLSGRIKGRDSSMNSLYISVDSSSKMVWNVPVANSYAWYNFGTDLNLSSGSHVITFSGREQNTELDEFQLALASASAPASSPTPAPVASATPVPSPTPAPTPVPTSSIPSSSSSLNPSVAPGSNFDLALWKLTLPIDSSGGFSGTAIEIKSLSSTYQIEPYFYTATDGAMVFNAPTYGATTSGSHYPRSELREMAAPGVVAAWTVAQGGTLSATLAVNQVPTTSTGAKGRVIIGQIHGPADELCRLYYDNGVIYFHDDKAGSSQVETQFDLKDASGAKTKIPLDAKFDYTINANSSKLTVSVVYNGVTYTAADPISAFWPGKALYFKAGVYVQVAAPGSGAGTVGTGWGQTSFYRLPRPVHP